MEEFRKFFKGSQGSPNEQRDAPFLRCYDFAALEPVRRADLRRNGSFAVLNEAFLRLHHGLLSHDAFSRLMDPDPFAAS